MLTCVRESRSVVSLERPHPTTITMDSRSFPFDQSVSCGSKSGQRVSDQEGEVK